MIDYIIIILAVVCFAGQFAFTKLYEGSVRQTNVTALVMLFFTGMIGTILYLFIGGFRVGFSSISVFWAVFFCTCYDSVLYDRNQSTFSRKPRHIQHVYDAGRYARSVLLRRAFLA